MDLLISTAPLAGIALVALSLGMVVREQFSADRYRNIIKGVLFVAAVVLIGQYFLAV